METPREALIKALRKSDVWGNAKSVEDAADAILDALHPCPEEGHYIEGCECWLLIKVGGPPAKLGSSSDYSSFLGTELL